MPPKKRVIYQYTSDNSYMNLPDEFEGDLPRAEYDDLVKEGLEKQRKAMRKYRGDSDRDSISDPTEISIGLHDSQNNPQHQIKRYGPTTPGSARAVKGRGIEFDYDNDIIDLRVHPFKRGVGKPYTMPSPKPFKLDIDFGTSHMHVNNPGGYKMRDLNLHPEKHSLEIKGIKGIGFTNTISPEKKKTFLSVDDKKYGINKLGKNLSESAKRQKPGNGTHLIGIGDLNFEIVGLTPSLRKKKRCEIL